MAAIPSVPYDDMCPLVLPGNAKTIKTLIVKYFQTVAFNIAGIVWGRLGPGPKLVFGCIVFDDDYVKSFSLSVVVILTQCIMVPGGVLSSNMALYENCPRTRINSAMTS